MSLSFSGTVETEFNNTFLVHLENKHGQVKQKGITIAPGMGHISECIALDKKSIPISITKTKNPFNLSSTQKHVMATLVSTLVRHF